MSDVVVIGAGLGGLASAALLAKQGHRVTVFEQSADVGGKLGRHHRDGLNFDTGPSLLTLPDILREIFEQTGGWPEILILEGLSPIARIRFADGSGFDVPNDLDQFCATLSEWSPGAGDDWRRFHAHAERIWHMTHGPFLESELHGTRTLAGLALHRPVDLFTIAPWRTLASLAKSHLRDPRLRQFLWRYATYTGSDPRRAPAALAAIPYAEQHFGGWYVRGGLFAIAAALAERCTELGIDLKLNHRVSVIHTLRGAAVGVRLASGEQIAADVVVANADAQQVYENLLPGSDGARTRRALRKAPRSYSGFVLLLGVRGPRPPDLAHHTVLFGSDSANEFDQLRAGSPVTDPTIYVSAPPDETVSSTECFPVFVLVNAPRQDQFDWTASDRATREDYATFLLELMAQRGMDLRNSLAFTQIRTPADIEAATLSPGGAIYGSSSDGARSAFLRPANRTEIQGLYLVGGSAHPGGGIPLVLLSAGIVSRLIGPASP